jgi:uncharacterized protein (TIGR00369 family)
MAIPADESLVPFASSPTNRCFGCGEASPIGLRLKFLRTPDNAIVSFPVVSDVFGSLPDRLHGGVIATILDEVMSKAVLAQKPLSVTRTMEVEYLHPVPSGVKIRAEGWLVRSERRKHWTESRILNEEGAVLARGTALFIELLPKH